MKFNELSIMKQLKVAADMAGVNSSTNPFHHAAPGSVEVEPSKLEALNKLGITYNSGLVQDQSYLYITCGVGKDTRYNPWNNANTADGVRMTFRMCGEGVVLDLTTNNVDVDVFDLKMDRFGLTSEIVITDDVVDSLINVSTMLESMRELIGIGPEPSVALLKLVDALNRAKDLPEELCDLIGEYRSKTNLMRAIIDTLRFENYEHDEDGNIINLPYVYVEGHMVVGLRVQFGNKNSNESRHGLRIKYDEVLGGKYGTITIDSSFNYNTYINLLEKQVEMGVDDDAFIELFKQAVTDASLKDKNIEITKPLYEELNKMLTDGLPFIKERLKKSNQ